MIDRKEGAAHRQANRSASNTAQRRTPQHSITAQRTEYEHASRIAAWVIGIAFGLIFALGIIAG